MKEVVLEDKIHQFLARKEQQFPELHRSVNDITSDLIAEDRVRNLSHREDRADMLRSKRRHSVRFQAFHYAV